MKLKENRILLAPCAFFLLLGFSSCDKLDDPVIDVIPVQNPNLVTPEFDPLETDIQRVLVEDFTAHQCGNCPPAAVKIEEWMQAHGEVIVPLAIHAGGLADTNEDFPMDWTCEEGNAFWSDLSFQGNPLGRINRLPSENEGLFLSQWDATLEPLLAATPPAGLQSVVDYIAEDQELVVHTHVTWFQDVDGPVRLALLIAESNIIAPQSWYDTVDPPGPGVVSDYNHKHLLRGSVTGAKGLVVTEDAGAGDETVVTYAVDWNVNWNADNAEVLAVLTNSEGHVIQVLSSAVNP